MKKSLCKGYIKTKFVDAEGAEVVGTISSRIAVASFEIVFAVLPGGEILRTIEIETTDHPNNNFDAPGRLWSRIFELPAGVEFIGNYPSPKENDTRSDRY